MILPKNRFTFSSADREGKEIGAQKIAAAILAVIGFFTVLGFIVFRDEIRPFGSALFQDRADLYELWEDGEYERVTEISERIFSDNPMDKTALVLGGFGWFYRGVYEIETDLQVEHMDNSVTLLRKALLHSRPPMRPQIYYILGKAYFHKGPFFYDLAVEFLEKSLEYGYSAADTYEYLTVAYGEIGDLEKSVKTLHAAVELNPNDMLFFSLGETYYQLGNYPEAKHYFDITIAGTDDQYLVQQSRFRIGEMYLEQGLYDESEQQFLTVLDDNQRSAQAHYLLGEVYNARGDHERARFQWREAIRIDPGHIDSLRSLQSN